MEKEKSNVHRLVGVMMPFMIMVIIRRLAALLLAGIAIPDILADTISFVASSVIGIVFFRLSCGKEALHPADTSDKIAETENDTADIRPVPPFPEKDTRLGRLLYTRIAVAGLVLAMHVVAATTDSPTDRVPDTAYLTAELVSLLLIHPILEEYLFRFLYYRELRPMQPFFAGLAQAIMFAIVHSSVGGMVYALFAGVILAFVTERSGSLAVAISSHILVNLRSFVYLTLLSDNGAISAVTDPARVRTVIDFIIVAVGFASVLLLWVRRGMREVYATSTDADDDTDTADIDNTDTDIDIDTEDTSNDEEADG